MSNDDIDDNDLTYIDEDDEENGFRRWMSFVVVLFAIGGFFALAWYAYHAGTKTANPEDVPLIEADNTPLKETPADPGGQQFPHQDKTVYDAISGGKSDKESVERVLPAPEEPVKSADASTAPATTAPSAQENMSSSTPLASSDSTTTTTTESASSEQPSTATVTTHTSAEPGKAKIITIDDKSAVKATAAPTADVSTAALAPVTTPAAPAATTPVNQVSGADTKPVETASIKKPEKEKLDTASIKKMADSAPAAGNTNLGSVQLGAYRSKAEAEQAWAKMLKSNSAQLNGKTYLIRKADLGAKGTYYRLRVVDVASAKQFCSQLSAKGQPCMVVK